MDEGMCGFAAVWNASERLAAGASAHDRAAPSGGAAARAYRLDRMPASVSPDLAS